MLQRSACFLLQAAAFKLHSNRFHPEQTTAEGDGRFLTVTWGPGRDGGLGGSIWLFRMGSLRSRLVRGSVASRRLGGLAAVVDAGTGLAAAPVERALLWFAFLGPGRRRPHLHDGINHTAVSLRCRSTEAVG